MSGFQKVLAIDTATASMTVALLENGRLAGERHMHAERNHSMYLLPAVQDLLKELGLRPNDVNAIAVGHGPGSYTGVRIGITVAKTIAWALKLPVVPVSSLEALALGGMEQAIGREAVVGGDAGAGWDALIGGDAADAVTKGVDETECAEAWFVPLLDARRGQAYTALFRHREARVGGSSERSASRWERLAPDGIRLVAPWLDQLAERAAEVSVVDGKHRRIVFVGETERFAELVNGFAPEGVETESMPFDLRAYHIGLLGLPLLRSGQSVDPHELVPNYTQLAEAEAKLLAVHKGL